MLSFALPAVLARPCSFLRFLFILDRCASLRSRRSALVPDSPPSRAARSFLQVVRTVCAVALLAMDSVATAKRASMRSSTMQLSSSPDDAEGHRQRARISMAHSRAGFRRFAFAVEPPPPPLRLLRRWTD